MKNSEPYLLAIALIAMVCGYYYGKNEMYEKLYDDKIECRLTADTFITDQIDEKEK